MTTSYRSIPFGFEGKEFGALMRSRRENAGLSQHEIAEFFGRSDSWVSQVERGDLKHGLYMRDYLAICNVLDLNPCAFFALTEE